MTNNIVTTQAVMETTPQLLRNAIDSRITKVRPMATPIDQISRLAGSHQAGSMEVAYYRVDSKPFTSETTDEITMSAAEYNSDTGKVVKAKVKDITLFAASDTVLLPAYFADSAKSKALTAYVVAVAQGTDSSGELTLAFPVNYKGNIASGSTIVRMGRAATELDVQTAQYVNIPTREQNYCQIFKMQVEQSILTRLSDKEVAWTFSEQEEAAVIDMRLGMEKNFLFGSKCKLYDTQKGEYVYMTNGIWNQAGKSHNIDIENASVDDFIDLAHNVFTGNNGSRKRLLIGGGKFVSAVSKMPFNDKVLFGATHSKWGLETREIATNFGSLYLLHSEVFDQCGHEYDAMVVDQAFISKFCHIPFRPEKLNLRASGTRNSDAVVLTEASCMVLRNPMTHCRIFGKPS